MRVEIEDDLITARYFAVPRPHEPPDAATRRRFVSIAIQGQQRALSAAARRFCWLAARLIDGGFYMPSPGLPALSASANSFSSSQRALVIEKETAKLTPRTQEKYHMERLIPAQSSAAAAAKSVVSWENSCLLFGGQRDLMRPVTVYHRRGQFALAPGRLLAQTAVL